MDGLTISSASKFIDSGNTLKDIKSHEMSLSSAKPGKGSFADTLKTAINEVDRLHKDADIKAQKLASGESKNIPEVMIAAEKADIALRLMVQVRNKVLNAYNEIMKMQV